MHGCVAQPCCGQSPKGALRRGVGVFSQWGSASRSPSCAQHNEFTISVSRVLLRYLCHPLCLAGCSHSQQKPCSSVHKQPRREKLAPFCSLMAATPAMLGAVRTSGHHHASCGTACKHFQPHTLQRELCRPSPAANTGAVHAEGSTASGGLELCDL